MKKIGIFGASSTGEYAFDALKEQYEIVFFADNETEKQGKRIKDTIIIGPDDIKQYKVDDIVIASVHYQEIASQMWQLGIKNVLIFLRWKKGEDDYKIFLNAYEPEKFWNVQTKNRERIFLDMLSQKKDLGIGCVEKVTERKRVLVIAYFFPPMGGGGVQRTLKYVKYLREFGYEPIVVTAGEEHYYWCKNDDTLLKEIPEDIQILRIKNRFYRGIQAQAEDVQMLYDMYAGVLQNNETLEKFWKNVVQKRPEEAVRPDQYVFWSMDVLQQISEKIDMRKIDIVYTTGSPFSDFFVGYYLKRLYGTPWVMDYRDLWTKEVYYLDRVSEGIHKLEEGLEIKMCMESDTIIITAPLFKKKMADLLPRVQDVEKLALITNGYDEMDFIDLKEEKGKKQFRICYGGFIYSGIETIDIFATAIQQINLLIEERRIEQSEVVFRIMGNREEKIQKILGKYDKYHIMDWQPYVEHQAYLEYAMNSQILFLPQPRVLLDSISGKTFEYIRLKGAILGIWNWQTRIKEIIEETERGKNFMLSDENGIREFIAELYTKWKNGQPSGYDGKKEQIERYERRNLTKLLAEEFDRL